MEARRIGWRPGRDGSRLAHYIVLISILVLILARGVTPPRVGYAVILLPLVGAPSFALSERNSPASIIVNMAGKRFMKESMPYVEACHHMYGGPWGQGPGPGENIPAWLVFDQRYRDRYILRDCSQDNAFRTSGWSPWSSLRPTHSRSWRPRQACPSTC